jgi:DnaJ-class molecular chaperone
MAAYKPDPATTRIEIKVRCRPCKGTGRTYKMGPSNVATFPCGTVLQTADYSTSETCKTCGGEGRVWTLIRGKATA